MQVSCAGPGGKGLLDFYCRLLFLSTSSQAGKILVMEVEPNYRKLIRIFIYLCILTHHLQTCTLWKPASLFVHQDGFHSRGMNKKSLQWNTGLIETFFLITSAALYDFAPTNIRNVLALNQQLPVFLRQDPARLFPKVTGLVPRNTGSPWLKVSKQLIQWIL